MISGLLKSATANGSTLIPDFKLTSEAAYAKPPTPRIDPTAAAVNGKVPGLYSDSVVTENSNDARDGATTLPEDDNAKGIRWADCYEFKPGYNGPRFKEEFIIEKVDLEPLEAPKERSDEPDEDDLEALASVEKMQLLRAFDEKERLRNSSNKT